VLPAQGTGASVDIDAKVGTPFRVRDASTGALLLDYPGATSQEPVSLIIDRGYSYTFEEDSLYGPERPPWSGEPIANARLRPEYIQSVVRTAFPRLRACHAEALRRDATLTGALSPLFIVTDDGQVGRVTIHDSSIPDEALVSCVVGVLEDLRFEKAKGSVATVVYPISFSREM
jgi:hypothetical protein